MTKNGRRMSWTPAHIHDYGILNPCLDSIEMTAEGPFSDSIIWFSRWLWIQRATRLKLRRYVTGRPVLRLGLHSGPLFGKTPTLPMRITLPAWPRYPSCTETNRRRENRCCNHRCQLFLRGSHPSRSCNGRSGYVQWYLLRHGSARMTAFQLSTKLTITQPHSSGH